MIAFGFISKMNDRSENSRTLLILLPLPGMREQFSLSLPLCFSSKLSSPLLLSCAQGFTDLPIAVQRQTKVVVLSPSCVS